jgi:hypothetical protein
VAPRTLTVLAAIRPGEEAPLRGVLRPIGDDIKGARVAAAAARPRVEFVRSRAIHFARFAILDDPDRGPGRKRLLYSANYDGDLDSHLAELMAITSDMTAIWGRLEGYTGLADFPRFIRAHAHEPEAFYIAFRDATVERVQSAITLRRRAKTLVDDGSPDRLAALRSRPSARRLPPGANDLLVAFDNAARSAAAAVDRLVRALPIVVDGGRAIAQCGFRNVFLGTQRIVASLDRYLFFRLSNRLTGNRMPPQRSAYSSLVFDNCSAPAPLEPGDEMPSASDPESIPTFREDVVSQNQLTVVTVVKPGNMDRVRAVMAAIDAFSKRLAPPGSLIGISTIHFVKWLVIDEGRRLMMVSDYDGSWESYIDEFAEMILSGLDAIWETAYGYPPDGARDLPAFKRFLRSHQVPSEVFFSAYPDETVLNIVNDLALSRACADSSAEPLRVLLQRW